jgi:hypothetical protein
MPLIKLTLVLETWSGGAGGELVGWTPKHGDWSGIRVVLPRSIFHIKAGRGHGRIPEGGTERGRSHCQTELRAGRNENVAVPLRA